LCFRAQSSSATADDEWMGHGALFQSACVRA
jgi:hypothetical protein